MVDQVTALKTAHSHIKSKYDCGRIGDMTVEPKDGFFQARLVELPGQDPGRTYVVDVNAASGDVGKSSVGDTEAAHYDGSVEVTIDGPAACDAALKAIAGYEHYDKMGRFSVLPGAGSYVVTFPIIASGGRDERGADYAYQITVDAHSGLVGQILTAS